MAIFGLAHGVRLSTLLLSVQMTIRAHHAFGAMNGEYRHLSPRNYREAAEWFDLLAQASWDARQQVREEG